MRLSLSALLCLIAALVAQHAEAQSRARIFDIELGSPVAALPANEWVDPSCGTNGGPPSLRLDTFADFARCPAEKETALHEVWFIYDNEWEYIARAYRDPAEIARFSANVFYGQPIVTSLLIDDAGLVQGYRFVTDPRAPTDLRLVAHTLTTIVKGQFRDGTWQCTDEPPADREQPVDGTFVKQDCAMVSADRVTLLQGRLLRKAGQGDFRIAEGYFESSTRLEVFARVAVRDAPCCRAFVPR